MVPIAPYVHRHYNCCSFLSYWVYGFVVERLYKRGGEVMNPIKLIIVDLFCGAGGVTTGFERTAGCKVICCINHDAVAIESHIANHPDAVHFIEDIRSVSMIKLKKVVDIARLQYPNAKLLIHASLECTNFSKAKGGKPRDQDSRSLADDMPRYMKALTPDYFTIENVMEFMSWGPLDDNGKPINKQAGSDYMRWIGEMKAIGQGYHYDWKQLNAADYGAYTIRKRLFAMFAKYDLPIAWPTPTHTKDPERVPMLGLKKWKPVKDILRLDVLGKDIFDRPQPLSEKTLERIYAGLIKFVAGGEKAFLAKYFSGRPDGKVLDVQGPTGAITTVDHHSLIQVKYFIQYNGKPKEQVYNTDIPSGTLTTKDRFALVSPQYIVRDFSKVTNTSIEAPAGSILTSPKMNLVSALLINYNSSTAPLTDVEQPAPTVTTVRTHYILNPQWFNTNPGDINQPSHTLIARMDKAPPYIVAVENGYVAIAVYDTDSPMTVKIKEFMAIYGISSIMMRMLMVEELLRIQGFPASYKLCGTQTNQKKFIGNSVETTVMHKWAEAIVSSIPTNLKLAI